MIKHSIWLVLMILFTSFSSLYSQKKNFTISGYVKEKKSKELLIGVNIYIPGSQTGTTSNSYGFYSITLPAQQLKLTYSYVGFTTQTLAFQFSKDTMITIELENIIELQGVEIVADQDNKISDDVSMSVVSVPIKQIKDIPAFLGEKDVFKVLQLMPGVRSGSEGSSGLYVRGGGPDQNLIILDDATVYNANHLFGFFSIFNGDAIKSVELTKGGFPARYGGRLSSVVDINMKDGNKTKFGGEAGIGVISSRLVLEGPIIKNKSSFLVSARRTYLDAITQPFIMAASDGNRVGYYFYDMNAKLNYDFGNKNKLYVSGYFGRDKFYTTIKNTYDNTETKFGLFWQNMTGTARWNHMFNNKLFANTSFIYSKYLFKVYAKEPDGNDFFELDYYSGIEDVSLKSDFTYVPIPNHLVKFGVLMTSHTFTPSAVVFKNGSGDKLEANISNLYSIESSVYAEDEFKIKANTKINAGFRIGHFQHKAKNYLHFEPRILASYMLMEDLSIKASYAVMNQNIHLLSNTGMSLPIDLWVPATDNIGPQKSQQIALGLAKDFKKPAFSLSAEIYYKTMKGIIAYKEGSSFLMVGDFEASTEFNYEESVTAGKGYSTGLEILAQKKYGKWTGWIGYTLSYTKYQFDELNNGKAFFPRHDRRHDISVVGMYEISKRITLSSTWVYGTGDAVTFSQASYQSYIHDEQNLQPVLAYNYGEKNSFRYAPYHRLDIGIQIKSEHKWGTGTWEFSIYNAYNRHNPFMYYAESNGSYSQLKQISLFPFIPSISYNVKF